MFVYLFLPFVYHFVPLFASGNPVKNLDEEISIRRLYDSPKEIILRHEDTNLGPHLGDFVWEWNAIETENYPTKEITKGKRLPDENEGKWLSNLEISKSVELVYDPKFVAFLPVMEVSNEGGFKTEGKNAKNAKNYENSLLLLSPHTRKQLNKIFEKFEKEVNGNRITDTKNYQTGRFKLHFRKGARF